MVGQAQKIFTKYLNNKPIFKNREALSTSFSPETIPHRETEVNTIAKILAPALKGGKPSNLFLYGRTGTGKTCVSRMVADELQTISNSNGHKLKTIYVNCKMKKTSDTEYRLMATLSKEFGKEVPFTGLPTDQIYNIFFESLDQSNQTLILILDEIDTLVQKSGDEILYNLTRVNQDLKNSSICIIGITNSLGFINSLDPRVKSSLGEEEMIFPPYNALQLQDILKNRAKTAFEDGIIEEGVVEKCAALAAQEHGDARRALDLLRVSAELAEREASEKVTIEHVDKAQDKIDLDRVIETVKAQPKQSQIVLWSILKFFEKHKREINTGDVMNVYNEVCKMQGTRPLTQRRVSDLIAELDLFGIINTKVISRGRYGRTRVITLSLSDGIMKRLKNFLQQRFL